MKIDLKKVSMNGLPQTWPICKDGLLPSDSMPSLVTIPISYFELVSEFERPALGTMLVERKELVYGLFDAFKPWDIKIDDIEVLVEGKPSEQGVKFRLPQKRVTFFFGPAFCRFSKDGASWDQLEEMAEILEAAFSVVDKAGKVSIALQKITLALHIQMKNTPFVQILKPFVPPQLVDLEPGDIKTVASVVVWNNRKVTLDGSGSVGNAIFMRLEREFKGDTGIYDMAAALRADEMKMFEILGIEEDLT